MTNSQMDTVKRDEGQVGDTQALPDADERLRRAAGILARGALRACSGQAAREDGGGGDHE